MWRGYVLLTFDQKMLSFTNFFWIFLLLSTESKIAYLPRNYRPIFSGMLTRQLFPNIRKFREFSLPVPGCIECLSYIFVGRIHHRSGLNQFLHTGVAIGGTIAKCLKSTEFINLLWMVGTESVHSILSNKRQCFCFRNEKEWNSYC